METGYMLQLGLSGIIHVVKDKGSLTAGKVAVLVCPDCGKIEAYVDYESIKGQLHIDDYPGSDC